MSLFGAGPEVMLVMKRLKIGRDWGTTVAWQEPVPRIVANMWRMQAWRSVLIIEGKTWAASTSAERAVVRRATASSLSSWRTRHVSKRTEFHRHQYIPLDLLSSRFGTKPVNTRTIIFVSSNSWSISSDKFSSSLAALHLLASSISSQLIH